MSKCCICGNEIVDESYDMLVHGESMEICLDCAQNLDDLFDGDREETVKILKEKMEAGHASPAVMLEVEEMIKDARNVKTEEKLQEKDAEREAKEAEDPGLFETWDRESRFSVASGKNLPYVVLQVTLKEKFLGTGSRNLEDLEYVINKQCEQGYRLHTMSTTNSDSKGFASGDRIQATLVFERLDIAGIKK